LGLGHFLRTGNPDEKSVSVKRQSPRLSGITKGSKLQYQSNDTEPRDTSEMTDSVTTLEQAIREAASQYFRLVILVGEPGSGKTAALDSIAQKHSCNLVNVNLELSKRMLELTRVHRPQQVGRLLKEIISSIPGEAVLLDNLEILFDTSLEVEPLRLLQLLSRNRTIVASWNGSYRDSVLTYAEPSHPEFIQLRQIEAIIITVGTSAEN
jgi:hypothetical protein